MTNIQLNQLSASWNLPEKPDNDFIKLALQKLNEFMTAQTTTLTEPAVDPSTLPTGIEMCHFILYAYNPPENATLLEQFYKHNGGYSLWLMLNNTHLDDRLRILASIAYYITTRDLSSLIRIIADTNTALNLETPPAIAIDTGAAWEVLETGEMPLFQDDGKDDSEQKPEEQTKKKPKSTAQILLTALSLIGIDVETELESLDHKRKTTTMPIVVISSES